MSELVKCKERIDVVCGVMICVGCKNQEVLCWCQGKVRYEIKGGEHPTVVVEWDNISDVRDRRKEATKCKSCGIIQ